MPARRTEFRQVFEILARHHVDFIVVGGAGAVLQGAPLQTLDLDLVHARSATNVDRLHIALRELDACYREHLPAKVLRPRKEDLDSPGHHLLMTVAGPLDLLGAIGRGRGFAELIDHTDEFTFEPALRIRVLDLPTLIAVKEEVGREKDLAVLPLLRRTLEARGRGEGS